MDRARHERRTLRRIFSGLTVPVLAVAMLVAITPAWATSGHATITFLMPSVSGDTATVIYTVDHGNQVIARLSCKLGPIATPCGTQQPGSRAGSSAYRVVLRGLAVGGHSFFVRVKLVNHEGALNAVRFSVAHCDAQNRRTRTQYYGTGANLQTAIDAASNGDTLDVWGDCVGNFTIGASGAVTLTLVGHATRAMQEASLNGDHSGAVLSIDSPGTSPNTVVTLRDMSIANGSDGGIINNPFSTAILNGTSQVVNNSGSGITNNLGSTVVLDDSAQVDGNTGSSGGGICNCDFAAILTLNDASRVDDNTATGTGGGGISNVNGASVSLNGTSQVDSNTTAGDGGGINSNGLAGVSLNGTSQVDNNVATGDGGGFYDGGSTGSLTGAAQVDDNTAGGDGGGIYVTDGGSVSGTTSSNVSGNKPDNCSGMLC
jgi:predicted outer membrane repeat protein